jgi:anaerobic magnesium-protoporphyrin IX monomethyl ester cyclase
MPNGLLLKELALRRIHFGVQLRIDLWDPDMLELLGSAGCVSIEAGVESVSDKGREGLSRRSGITFAEITDRLVFAKRHIRFVQANLIDTHSDDPAEIAAWREALLAKGVWANEPVPLFVYPGSPLYRHRWGKPDDNAWERAHADYMNTYARFSDIQDKDPLPLARLDSRG